MRGTFLTLTKRTNKVLPGDSQPLNCFDVLFSKSCISSDRSFSRRPSGNNESSRTLKGCDSCTFRLKLAPNVLRGLSVFSFQLSFEMFNDRLGQRCFQLLRKFKRDREEEIKVGMIPVYSAARCV